MDPHKSRRERPRTQQRVQHLLERIHRRVSLTGDSVLAHLPRGVYDYLGQTVHRTVEGGRAQRELPIL